MHRCLPQEETQSQQAASGNSKKQTRNNKQLQAGNNKWQQLETSHEQQVAASRGSREQQAVAGRSWQKERGRTSKQLHHRHKPHRPNFAHLHAYQEPPVPSVPTGCRLLAALDTRILPTLLLVSSSPPTTAQPPIETLQQQQLPALNPHQAQPSCPVSLTAERPCGRKQERMRCQNQIWTSY
ncbi:hypothetical protein NDU88_004971 [Pleurodeles waltl]|uniref:Uncharacterized protein n=1 Tax=Pleurodeles waltl TaxID=8319 RepID=A0AAV7TT08_PLEWA|nr:hypothetical protein NDU88_004971 [Pleurodeles waltl]